MKIILQFNVQNRVELATKAQRLRQPQILLLRVKIVLEQSLIRMVFFFVFLSEKKYNFFDLRLRCYDGLIKPKTKITEIVLFFRKKNEKNDDTDLDTTQKLQIARTDVAIKLRYSTNRETTTRTYK